MFSKKLQETEENLESTKATAHNPGGFIHKGCEVVRREPLCPEAALMPLYHSPGQSMASMPVVCLTGTGVVTGTLSHSHTSISDL